MNKKIWLLAFAFAFGLQAQAQGQTNGELPFLRVPRCLFFPLFAHAIGVYSGALGRGQIIDAPPAHLQEDERDDEYPESKALTMVWKVTIVHIDKIGQPGDGRLSAFHQKENNGKH